ncbi:hypothetical protein LJR164_001601 [Phenylobacterium sp. LjRoot164]|uniref:hypothetical protein n=1 Tax=unclassified Phenylobacterium TaxID=2640670 RepID=UPI003ED07C7B
MAWNALPFPETLDLTPDADGYRLWFDGEVIAKFGTLSNAARGLTTAREALAMLDTTLNTLTGSAA